MTSRKLKEDLYKMPQKLNLAYISPKYPPDEGPIPEEYIVFLAGYAQSLLPKGKIISSESIFEDLPIRLSENND